MLWVLGHCFYMGLFECFACLILGRRGWSRVFLETLDMSVSHSCACTCSAMAIVCAFSVMYYMRGCLVGFL